MTAQICSRYIINIDFQANNFIFRSLLTLKAGIKLLDQSQKYYLVTV